MRGMPKVLLHIIYSFLKKKKNPQSFELQIKLITFSLFIIFTWKNDWPINFDYLVFGI